MKKYCLDQDSADTSNTLQESTFDEHLLITREFTRVDSDDGDLHRLGFYWPSSVAAQPTK